MAEQTALTPEREAEIRERAALDTLLSMDSRVLLVALDAARAERDEARRDVEALVASSRERRTAEEA